MRSVVALHHARIQGGCCERLPPLPLSNHYTSLLHLIKTSPPEPHPSLNRLQLGSLDVSTFPVPPASSSLETQHAYRQLRTLLLNSTQYPLTHSRDRRAAARAAWTLVPPHGGLLLQEGKVNWEKLESVRRLLDRSVKAAELAGLAEHEEEVVDEEVDTEDGEDWAKIGGEWKWVLRGVNAEAAESWRMHVQSPDSVPRPAWSEEVAANENWTFGVKKLTLQRVPTSPDSTSPSSSSLPLLQFEVVSSTSDHPFSSSHPSAHSSKTPVSTQGEVTLTKDAQILVSFTLQHANLAFEGIMLGGPGGVFYGTMTSNRRREEGEITALFRMWK
ncbi:hypothetical protein BDY24DRAFT_378576 [Mrakia frigida]|uniref:uncharacterized protein n=1 Tax=Mrakia frigida TaxID=29902 RepID=UPI003FCC13CF